MLLAQVTPADVIGEALRLHLGPTAWPAVASRTFSVGSHHVTVEVLAASHRVQVRPGGADTATFVETVACGTADSAPVDRLQLPGTHDAVVGGAIYHFESVTRFGADEVRSAADLVRGIEDGLQVAFPGHPDALTGVRLDVGRRETDPAAISWTTWHVYPGALPHVVTTSSTLLTDRRSP